MLFMVRGNDGSATFLVLIHDNNYSQVYFAWKEIDNNLQIHDKLQQYNKFVIIHIFPKWTVVMKMSNPINN